MISPPHTHLALSPNAGTPTRQREKWAVFKTGQKALESDGFVTATALLCHKVALLKTDDLVKCAHSCGSLC
jgi:hypothetical protein